MHRQDATRLYKEDEEKYRRLVEASPDTIAVYVDGRIAYVNAAGARLFAAEGPEDLIGKPLLDLVHPDHREVVRERLQRVEEEGWQSTLLEQKLVRLDGRVVEVEATSIPTIHEGRPAVQALIRDISRRKRAEEELRESEARNWAILDASPDLMFLVDRAGEIRDFRTLDDGKLYVPRDRVVGSKIAGALPAGITDAALRCVERALDSGGTQTFEYRLSVPDGVRDFEARIVASGEDEALAIVRDVTERRSMEEELRRSEESFRTAFESASTGVALISLDRRFLRVNSALCGILGYPEEELLGKSTGEVTHPEDLEASRLRRERALQSGAGRYAIEKRYVRSDGRTVWVLSDLSVVRDDEGEPSHFVSHFQDITERKRAEEELRENEEWFRAIFENAALGISIADPDRRLLKTNSAYRELVGYSEEELAGKPIADLSHPDDLLADAEFNQELLAGELDLYQREKRYVRKDGEVIWVRPTISAVRDDGGVPRFLVGMVEDITERRRTEEALRRGEASLAEAQRIARIGNWSYEVGKDRMRWSDEMYRIFGFIPQGFEPTYKVLRIFVHPDDRERLRRAIRGALYRGEDDDIEYRIVRPDSEVRAVRTQYEMIHGEDGAPVELVGTAQDITERQEAEQRLREAEEKYRLLVEQIPAVAYIDRADVSDAAFYTSPRIEALLGYTPEEWLSGRLWMERIHPDDRGWVLEKDTRARAAEEPFGEEYRLIARDGRVVWVRDESALLRDEAGRPLLWQGILLDVTERKEAEEEIRRSEERFRQLFDQSVDTLLVHDEEGRIFDCNAEACRSLGYAREEILQLNISDLLDEEERGARNGEMLWRRIVAGEPVPPAPIHFGEHRRKDGTAFPIEVREGGVDYGGRRLILASVRDITERRRAERKVRESEAHFRTVVESLGEGLLITDPDDVVLYMNSRMTELTGYAREELLGRPAHEVLLPSGRWAEARERNRKRTEGFSERYEVEILRKDGERIWVEVNGTPYRDAAGEVVGTLGAIIDITERKKAAEKLRRQADLLDLSHEPIFAWELDGVIVYWNRGSEELYGFPREAALGRVSHRLLQTVHPVPIEQFELALEREGQWIGELTQTARDGRRITVESRHMLARAPDGRRLVLETNRDITERKRTEAILRESEERHRRQARELELLHQVRTTLARELELPEVFRAVVEAIARTYGYTLVSAYLLQDETLVLQHQVGYEHVLHRIPVDRGIMGRVVRTGQPVLLGDVRGDPAFLGAIEGITSELCVPLLDEGRVVGTLNIESTRGVGLTEDDLRLMSALAEHVNAAISQARLYARVRESEERFRSLVQNASDIIIVMEADGAVRYVSPAMEQVLGYKPEEVIGRDNFEPVYAGDLALARGLISDAVNAPGSTVSAELRLRHADGSLRRVESNCTSLLDDPSVNGIVINSRDITERKRAEEARRKSEARHRAVVDNAFDAIITATAEGEIRSFNRRAETMFGYEAREVIGRPLALLVPERVREPRPNGSPRHAEEAGPGRTMEVTARNKEGAEFPVELSIAEVREGDDVLLTSIIRDITERKAFEAQLTYQALHDPLTDLPNRTLFLDRLEHALTQMRRREDITLAVLFIDLDDFKNVNDSLGHEMGDELLKAASDRLRRCMRPRDTAARLGGDEFAILLEDIGGLRGAARVAERIIEELRACFELRGHEVFVTPSIGISLCGSSDQRRAEDMLRDADLAMYKAKERGKANYQVFDPIMYQKVLERLDLEKDLRRAVERGEFVLHYQPKVLLKTGRIAGVEALVRWEHPERGLVLPEEFVQVAEETALISPLGAWVLEETCRRASRWREGGLRELLDLVSVNLSAIQLQRPDLIEEVSGVLRKSGLDPRNLSLEITESVVMSEAPHNIARLDELKDLGVKLAIDDFGTGYSSLSYLRRFPVSYLKIDRTFIEGLRESPEDTAVVSGIIALAHVLGMETIAEGVESAEQLRALRDLGCDMAQGNYFSEPLTDEDLPGFLAADPRW